MAMHPVASTDLPTAPAARLRAVSRRGRAAILIVLALTVWVARYWHSPRFGLYEDDLTIVPRTMEMSGGEVVGFVAEYIVNLYGHARPLSDGLIYLLSWAGWQVGGLLAIYWIGYGIVALNVLLFYALLRRLHASEVFSLIGGLAYALFSADTTQAYLTHSLGLQPSLLLLLLALHAYLSKKHGVVYLLGLVMLFSYESPFPVLFAAPLLQAQAGRRLARSLFWNSLILGMMLAAVIVFRIMVGEGRVTGMSPGQAVTTSLLHMLQGPPVSLGTYAYRPIQAVAGLEPDVLGAALAGALAFGVVIWRLGPGPASSEAPDRSLLRWALVGGVMLILAYAFTFTVRAHAISGRDTRVHLAAGIGSAMICASIGTLLFQTVRPALSRRILLAGMATWMGLLLGFGFVVQSEYIRAWSYQRSFWTSLVPWIADAGDGTVILVEGEGLSDARQIAANTWALPLVLERIYRMPEAWAQVPRVYRLAEGWEERIVAHDFQFRLNALTVHAPPELEILVPMRQVIFVVSRGDVLERWRGPLTLQGEAFELRPEGAPVLSELGHTRFYEILIAPEPAGIEGGSSIGGWTRGDSAEFGAEAT